MPIIGEIDILIKVQSKHVVKYYDAWQDNDYFYIKMELCKDNLKDVIQYKHKYFGRMPDEKLDIVEYVVSLSILRELAEGVKYLHNQTPSIIHRDLKPANVLISDYGLKLCDFGLAKIHEVSDHTKCQGTQKYRAPEVIMGRQYNDTADVFSLSVIALELIGYKIQNEMPM